MSSLDTKFISVVGAKPSAIPKKHLSLRSRLGDWPKSESESKYSPHCGAKEQARNLRRQALADHAR
jgi:hypothetical protein